MIAASVVLDVLQRLGADHAVERPVGQRQTARVAAHDPEAPGPLAGGAHLAKHARGGGKRPGVEVRRDDERGPAPVGLEGMPPLAAAHVQHAVPGRDAQTTVVDGQQSLAPFRRAFTCA